MSTAVTRKELAAIVGEKTLAISDRAELARSVAAYIATEKKPVDIDSLVRDVMQYRLERGYVEAIAYSAHVLPDNVLIDIEKLLQKQYPKAHKVHIDNRIDETAVGGVRIELPNETLDLSIRSKLNLFKRRLSEERN